jgi:hypothetical protein
MNKKLKITESQYNRLLNLLLETPFDALVKNTINVGDVVSITWKGSKNNFKVVDDSSGHIIMDNIDTGSTNINYRYFMAFTSLDGDDLELRRVHKTKEADKLNNIKSWSLVTVKDITNIEIFRNNKLIDTIDPVSPTAEKELAKNGKTSTNFGPDFINDVNNNLSIILDGLKVGKGLKVILNNAEVVFCCSGVGNGNYELELNKNKSIPSLNKWDSFSLKIESDESEPDNLYELNKNLIKTTDKGLTFDIKLKVRSGVQESEIWLTKIKGVSITVSCDDHNDDELDKTKDDEVVSDKLKNDAINAFEIITKDPTLKAAFYSQPTFWQAFVAQLKGEKPKSNSILPILDILDKYNLKNDASSKFMMNFNVDKLAKFSFLRVIDVPYKTSDRTNDSKSFTTEKQDITVRRYVVSGADKVLIKDLGDGLFLRILVKEEVEGEDTFRCELEIGELDNKKWVNKTIGIIDANIKFFQSPGYNVKKDINNK